MHRSRTGSQTDERLVSEPRPAARRAAVETTGGALTGVYAPGELASLREDWPA